MLGSGYPSEPLGPRDANACMRGLSDSSNSFRDCSTFPDVFRHVMVFYEFIQGLGFKA